MLCLILDIMSNQHRWLRRGEEGGLQLKNSRVAQTMCARHSSSWSGDAVLRRDTQAPLPASLVHLSQQFQKIWLYRERDKPVFCWAQETFTQKWNYCGRKFKYLFAEVLLVIAGSLRQCRNVVRVLRGGSCLGRPSWTVALPRDSGHETPLSG